MRRGMRAGLLLLGVAALGAGLGGVEAKAAGIKVAPLPIVQSGDPTNYYSVYLSLDPGTGFWLGDDITFYSLPGFDSKGFWNTPSGTPTDDWSTHVDNLPNGEFPGYTTIVPFANIRFTYANFSVPKYDNAGTSNLDVGRFTVITEDLPQIPMLPPGYSFTVKWVAHVHDLTTGNQVERDGLVTFSVAVPEPASVMLMGVAVAGLPGLLYLRRRRRQAA